MWRSAAPAWTPPCVWTFGCIRQRATAARLCRAASAPVGGVARHLGRRSGPPCSPFRSPCALISMPLRNPCAMFLFPLFPPPPAAAWTCTVPPQHLPIFCISCPRVCAAALVCAAEAAELPGCQRSSWGTATKAAALDHPALLFAPPAHSLHASAKPLCHVPFSPFSPAASWMCTVPSQHLEFFCLSCPCV